MGGSSGEGGPGGEGRGFRWERGVQWGAQVGMMCRVQVGEALCVHVGVVQVRVLRGVVGSGGVVDHVGVQVGKGDSDEEGGGFRWGS